jgi:hypothetical protein
MNDFNFYTRRDVIPVLRSRAEVESLLGTGEGDFLLIKERDMKRLAIVPRETIVASESVGSTHWHLVALGNSTQKGASSAASQPSRRLLTGLTR